MEKQKRKETRGSSHEEEGRKMEGRKEELEGNVKNEKMKLGKKNRKERNRINY